MRILHFYSSKVFAGLERHVEELSFQQSHNNEVAVVGPSNLKDKFRSNYIALNTNQWRHSPFIKWDVKKILESFNPDIVHTHAFKMTSFVAGVNKNFKHVSTIHGSKKNIHPFLQSDFIFGVSEKSLGNLSLRNSQVLENWVDENRFKNFKKSEGEYALYLGRFEAVKNLQRLIKSWQNIKEKLLLVGDGKQKKEIISFVRFNGLENIVSIDESSDNVSKILEKAKVLIISSDREGSPKVVYEALYCGVPVLSTDCGNLKDLLPSSCVSKIDDSDFKKLLSKWSKDFSLLKNEQRDVFTKIKNENTLKVKAQEVLEIYKSLLSKASK
jgi:glycosyltransferase involved in cell wall biosynthesis|tara:strand:+ start:10513 stop:11493 length:981 start_codon:yes stop_codon:yes gene_type:complete